MGIVLADPLTPKEVAREERVHYETVMRWIRSGQLKAYAPNGRNWRVRRIDLEAMRTKGQQVCAICRRLLDEKAT